MGANVMRIHTQRLVIGIGLLAVVGFIATPLALAANNAGDVKVKNPDGTGSPENHPHVGCSFFVEGFNMDATSGTIEFRVWPPSGLMTVVHATGAAETWTSDGTNAHGNHHFLSGPYELPAIGDSNQGTHYKVTASDTRHDKTKVFWTQCEQPPCTEDCNPCTENCNPCTVDCNPCTVDCNPCTENCTPPCEVNCTPTTEVPFFPSTTSMVLGAMGAVGSIFVAVLRRR